MRKIISTCCEYKNNIYKTQSVLFGNYWIPHKRYWLLLLLFYSAIVILVICHLVWLPTKYTNPLQYPCFVKVPLISLTCLPTVTGNSLLGLESLPFDYLSSAAQWYARLLLGAAQRRRPFPPDLIYIHIPQLSPQTPLPTGANIIFNKDLLV